MTFISAVLAATLTTAAQTPAQTPQPQTAQGQPTTRSGPAPQVQQPAPPGQRSGIPHSRRGEEVLANLQGFNIVLLIGESQSSGASIEDVPAAAKKALADMRDFLPFKNYRVLDSQWTSCCSNASGSWISGRLRGVTAAVAGSEMRLVPRSYSFRLGLRADARLEVGFSLTPDSMSSRAEQSPISTAREAEFEKRLAELRRELDTIEDEIPRRAQGSANSPEVAALQQQRRRIQQKIAETTNEITGLRQHGPEVDRSNHALIDSSFTMDLGETVVVGTSRLGGDKALIAIVTAARKGATSR